MGKPAGKNKKKSRITEPSVNLDTDATVFIDMARDLKEEGNKLFQKKDYKAAILTYEKSIKLLPNSHAEIASLRSNLAACYMQLDPPDYHRALENCSLALEVSPKYSKALLKRAKCYEAVDRLDFALRDVESVLSSEPTNATALEISERVKKSMDSRGIKNQDSTPESYRLKMRNKPKKKKKTQKTEEAAKEEIPKEVESMKVKLVLGEDIRFALVPFNCSVLQLREIVKKRFPNTEAILIKYKDEEGDLVTITTNEELRWAEESGNSLGSLKLFISQVTPDQDPFFLSLTQNSPPSNENEKISSSYVEEWIVLFAQLFKTHLGFSVDGCLDLHELGMKLYSEAMGEVVGGEDAQKIFNLAESKFREMAALALFNWGNIHMCKGEYQEAGKRFNESIKLKPDFYEGFIALSIQQLELAKLTLESSEALELLDKAEDNVEKGTQLWEDEEEKRLREILEPGEEKLLLQKMGLMGFLKEISTDEAAEQASCMKSQISILWGTMLYERSVIEFKLEMPLWEECLAAAVEKFKLAGASPTDLAVMIKNHCSNSSAQEGIWRRWVDRERVFLASNDFFGVCSELFLGFQGWDSRLRR